MSANTCTAEDHEQVFSRNARRVVWLVGALLVASLACTICSIASAADCTDRKVGRAVREVTGRDPHPRECDPARWGHWRSYSDLRARVQRQLGRYQRTRVSTQKLARDPWARNTPPAELALPVTSGVSNEPLPYFYW